MANAVTDTHHRDVKLSNNHYSCLPRTVILGYTCIKSRSILRSRRDTAPGSNVRVPQAVRNLRREIGLLGGSTKHLEARV